MNPIYSAMKGGQPNIMQMLRQFKQNPAQALMQSRFRLPQNVSMNDPNAIINHLVQSGQVSQAQINSAYQAAQRFGIQPSSMQTDVNKQTERT